MARAVAASSEAFQVSESWISVLQSCPCRLSLFVAALELQPEPATPRQLRHLTSTARLPCPTLPSLPPQFASGYCTVHSPHHCTTAPHTSHTPHSRSQGLTSPPVDHSHAHAFVRTHFHCLWRCPRPKLAPWLLPHEQAQFSIVCRHHASPSFAERSGAHLGPLCSLWGMPAGSTPAAFYLLYPCTPRFLPLWFASRPGNTRRKPIFVLILLRREGQASGLLGLEIPQIPRPHCPMPVPYRSNCPPSYPVSNCNQCLRQDS